MEKYLKATGVMAATVLGVCGAQAQSKPWTVSGSVRGFYDDNYATAPSSPAPGQAAKQSSYGVEVSPGAGFTWKRDQTDVTADYLYTLRYYENRANSADHMHQFDARVDQKFGADRYRATLKESFVIAQESALIDPALAATPLRSNGDNLRNQVSLSYSMDVTGPLSLELGYTHSYYDYSETGPGSRSALLDRTEHLAMANLRWELQRTTIGLVGYQFGISDQSSKDFLDTTLTLQPNIRDSRSHYGYVGVDHFFTEKLSAHPRVGVQYTEFPNAPAGSQDSTVGPYADLSASYTYSENCAIDLGVRHSRTQTDVAVNIANLAAGSTLDASTTAIYANWRHEITAKISANALLQYQGSEFNQGAASKLHDKYAIAGLSLAYKINEYLTAETGYNYDRLLSDLASRSFTRNRVFIGIRAKY